MKKSQELELRKRVGDLSALTGMKDYVLNDGPAKGVRAFDVNNGNGLTATIVADRGLDIAYLAFNGVNMGFIGKPGLRAPQFYVEDGVRGFLKQFFGGMLTTCGITYAGAPCEDEGRVLGLHGPYSNTPASGVSAKTVYEGDEAVLEISGTVHESCVFGENMRLDRTIRVYTESGVIEIHDHVTNLGFEDQPVMLVYHINFGYPMLDAGAKVYTNAKTIQPRDEWARSGPGVYNVMDAPEIGRGEQCYFCTKFKDDEGYAMIHNEALGIAGIVSFDPKSFPLLCEWKCMMAGDYALGLEPTVAGVMGRANAREAGVLPILKPNESADYRVKLQFTTDEKVIAEYAK